MLEVIGEVLDHQLEVEVLVGHAVGDLANPIGVGHRVSSCSAVPGTRIFLGVPIHRPKRVIGCRTCLRRVAGAPCVSTTPRRSMLLWTRATRDSPGWSGRRSGWPRGWS